MTDELELAPNEPELIAKWESKIKAAKSARLAYEQQWHLNMAFYMRRQWVIWSGASASKLVEPVAPKNKVRLTVNKVRIASRRELAKLNKERIRGYIAAASSDDSDLAAARAGEKINDYLMYKAKVSNRMKLVDFYCIIYGTAFAKHYFDPEMPGPTGPVGKDEMGNDITQVVPGMPTVEALSPFRMYFPNLDETDIENQEWVCQESVLTKHQIAKEHGVEVEEDGFVADAGDSLEQTAYGKLGNNSRKGVVVHEIWIKPCDDYPEGAVITKTKTKILSVQMQWPYLHGEYPFSRRIHIETGRFYGESTITDMIPLQVEYNKSRSQLIENKNAMSRPQLIAPKGSIDVKKMTNTPGLVIEYRNGFQPPMPMPLSPLPAYVIQQIEMLKNEMEDITSQYEISQGRVPPGVEAATAISYLMENQDSILQDALRDKENAHEKVCRQFLSYVIQFWDAERIIRVAGRNQNFEAYILKGADLKGNFDYRVEVGSATPIARSAKQAQIMELVKMGMIPVEKGLQHLEMGDTAKLFEQMQEDARHAERENLKMANGVPVGVNPFDEHMRHLQVHDSYRKREEYEDLDDNIKLLIAVHVLDHLTKAIESVSGQSAPPVDASLIMNKDLQSLFTVEAMYRSFLTTLSQPVGEPEQNG